MNEWAFAAEIKSWWDASLSSHPMWNLDRCEVERPVDGTMQRSDLAVLSDGTVRLAGELRLPDHPVASPWHPENLRGALSKAVYHGTRWCFTSDGTSILLLDAERQGPPQARVVQSLDLVDFTSRQELDSPTMLARTRVAWTHAIERLAPVVTGRVVPTGLPTDEAFISSLRALLAMPVAAIRAELDRRRRMDRAFEHELVRWMVEEQGWTHVPAQWDDEIRRTAQLVTYVFVTRLMFYDALRQAHPGLSALGLAADITAPVARATISSCFSEAMRLSGDYETVFTWDAACEYAMLAESSIPGWRRVLDHLAAFDLANVGYDVMGRLFERLIDPHERYRWGQHYTQPDVVDLMVSLAIPDGEGAVLDPATGGGTFLVRAYQRKRTRRPEATHQDLLAELLGLEVSAFAANLATVNLAVRSLDFQDNYPRIALRSFFLVRPHMPVFRVPQSDGSVATEALDTVAAVIGNPPYVRLHSLGPDRIREASSVLQHPVGRVPVPSRLRGAANYHMYFWFHGAQFLQEHGRLVLITSGEWLDSDYGVVLQEWLLSHFRIDLVIESMAEPWFSDARVGTVVLAATREREDARRDDHVVRFVTLRRPLRDLYGATSGEVEHLEEVDRLRDRLLALPPGSGVSADLDWSAIEQAELRAIGTVGRPVAAP